MSWVVSEHKKGWHGPRPTGTPSPPYKGEDKKLTKTGERLKNKVNNKYKEIKSNFGDWSDRYYKKQLLKLDMDEIKALEHYISGETLRGNIELGYLDNYQESLVKNLDSAIKKCKIPHNIKLYRGTSIKHYKNIEKGSAFIDKGFVSASIDKNYAKTWSEEMAEFDNDKALFIEIRCKKGQNGIYVGNHPWNFNKWFKEGGSEPQREMILSRDKIFRVLDKTNDIMVIEML